MQSRNERVENLYGAASLRHCETLTRPARHFVYGNECELHSWITETYPVPGTHSHAFRHTLAIHEGAKATVIYK